jgi:sphinganine-1-phosphate aldolase
VTTAVEPARLPRGVRIGSGSVVGASADGELELPTRMAAVNAMLDVASPATREALPKAFLGRLPRPVRHVA